MKDPEKTKPMTCPKCGKTVVLKGVNLFTVGQRKSMKAQCTHCQINLIPTIASHFTYMAVVIIGLGFILGWVLWAIASKDVHLSGWKFYGLMVLGIFSVLGIHRSLIRKVIYFEVASKNRGNFRS